MCSFHLQNLTQAEYAIKLLRPLLLGHPLSGAPPLSFLSLSGPQGSRSLDGGGYEPRRGIANHSWAPHGHPLGTPWARNPSTTRAMVPVPWSLGSGPGPWAMVPGHGPSWSMWSRALVAGPGPGPGPWSQALWSLVPNLKGPKPGGAHLIHASFQKPLPRGPGHHFQLEATQGAKGHTGHGAHGPT